MIAECLARIREYTKRDDRLREATICSFDVRLPYANQSNDDSTDIVVFGLNEAEYHPADLILRENAGHILEDNSSKNFREFSAHDELQVRLAKEQSAGEAKKWYGKVRSFIGADASVVLGEFFFWSSVNTKVDFAKRYGTTFVRSPHLQFCRDQNIVLLAHYAPRLVIVSGSAARRCERLAEASLYNLVSDRDHHPVHLGRYPVRFYRERANGRPWIFSPHFSGAHGVGLRDHGRFQELVIQKLGNTRPPCASAAS